MQLLLYTDVQIRLYVLMLYFPYVASYACQHDSSPVLQRHTQYVASSIAIAWPGAWLAHCHELCYAARSRHNCKEMFAVLSEPSQAFLPPGPVQKMREQGRWAMCPALAFLLSGIMKAQKKLFPTKDKRTTFEARRGPTASLCTFHVLQTMRAFDSCLHDYSAPAPQEKSCS